MLSSLPAYAELHCLSNYSFLRGASHPDELVRRATGESLNPAHFKAHLEKRYLGA